MIRCKFMFCYILLAERNLRRLSGGYLPRAPRGCQWQQPSWPTWMKLAAACLSPFSQAHPAVSVTQFLSCSERYTIFILQWVLHNFYPAVSVTQFHPAVSVTQFLSCSECYTIFILQWVLHNFILQWVLHNFYPAVSVTQFLSCSECYTISSCSECYTISSCSECISHF